MRNFRFTGLVLIILLTFSVIAFGQTRVRKNTKKTTKPDSSQTNTTTTETEKPQETVKTTTKKNERPTIVNSNQTTKNNLNNSVYFYEFEQPNFIVSKIYIEHDEQGKGIIKFEKRDFGEEITDPLQLSAATLEKIKNAFKSLDFLNSTEKYQYEKDYSHLGNVKITVKKDGRERLAEYNWTNNKDAKLLMDEYRKIALQYVWIFDINVSRTNQPLNAPALMDTLDGYLRRNEISDPPQLIPFLTELSNDERIPLIARNHATKLVKRIEKESKK